MSSFYSASWNRSIAADVRTTQNVHGDTRLFDARSSEVVWSVATRTVTSDASVEALFKACGRVDHVVVTAAQLRSGPIKTLSIEDAKATLESKFWGAWRVARYADIAPGGSLTIVSGYFSIRPRPGVAIVSASNGALESLVRSLALELAPVRVNAVSPGLIDTPIRAAMPEEARRKMLEQTAAALPVKRVGVGEDVARQILAFMTIGFATGSIVYLDGGGSLV